MDGACVECGVECRLRGGICPVCPELGAPVGGFCDTGCRNAHLAAHRVALFAVTA